jgi:hypothetical protein
MEEEQMMEEQQPGQQQPQAYSQRPDTISARLAAHASHARCVNMCLAINVMPI